MTTPAKIAADAMIKLVVFMLPPKIFFQTSEQFPVRTKFNVLPSRPGLDDDAFYATDTSVPRIPLRRSKMYKKVAVLTACVAATALLLAVSSARAEDAEGGEGGGATASAAEMPDICKAQAAKRSLTGSEAEAYLKQCAAPVGDAEKSAAPADRLEGKL